MGLEGDSLDYNILFDAAVQAVNIPGLFCEIGTRRGGSFKYIVDAIDQHSDSLRHIVLIDPYGNIEYNPGDDRTVIADYDNNMKNDSLPNIYEYAKNKLVNVVFFNLEDTEFFKRFYDGVPVYNNFKELINKYALVFFDGPHDTQSILLEVMFFMDKIETGGVFIFDDVETYNHESIHNFLLNNGFTEFGRGTENRKISYIKTS